jgi:hypothetical protein
MRPRRRRRARAARWRRSRQWRWTAGLGPWTAAAWRRAGSRCVVVMSIETSLLGELR